MPTTPASEQRSFNELVESIPQSSRRTFAQGLPLFERLDDAQFDTLIDLALQGLAVPYSLDQLDAPEKLGLSENEALTLVTAAVFLSSTVRAKESLQELAAILKKHYPVSHSASDRILRFIEEVRKRGPEIKLQIRERRLSNAVLPSLEYLEMTVDARMEFDGGDITLSVPVAVAYLKTDAAHERLWFQLSKPQVKSLIKQLGDTLSQMEKTEEWAKNRPKE
jgi:hypothetical protein